MLMACFLTTAFVVLGTCAWHLRHNRFPEHARTAFSMALGMVVFLAPLQLVIGDLHGLNTLKHQPIKVAAMEGHWETQKGAPLLLFAVPDQKAETNHWQIAIPKLGSLILTHHPNGEVPGLKSRPPEERPPVAIVFYAFRLMVGLGLLMIFVGGYGFWLRRKGRMYDTPWFLRLCIWCTPIGFIALLAGWFVTEVGRQPWTVYGLLHRADSVSPALTGPHVLTSLLIYAVAYTAIFGTGIYYLIHIARQGPLVGIPSAAGIPTGRRPLSGADVPLEEGNEP
jgi:cytochrome d ubiquinol oxidase subunit I